MPIPRQRGLLFTMVRVLSGRGEECPGSDREDGQVSNFASPKSFSKNGVFVKRSGRPELIRLSYELIPLAAYDPSGMRNG